MDICLERDHLAHFAFIPHLDCHQNLLSRLPVPMLHLLMVYSLHGCQTDLSKGKHDHVTLLPRTL